MNDRATATRHLIADALDDPEFAWSIDSFGAIAEFSWSRDEVQEQRKDAGGGMVVTPRGGLYVQLPDDAEAIAYEGLSGRADAWNQAIVLTVPVDRADVDRRLELTDLGPDTGAIRPEDRGAHLFDMGLGTRNIDVGVRSDEPTLLEALGSVEGTGLLSKGNPAMAAIKLASPTRVFRSAAGRIEVYQQIGSTQRDIPTPEGPHTHILPGLLSRGRTHAATTPVPEGRLPVMTLYPANPVTDELGRRRPFDHARHTRFQGWIEQLAPAGYAEEKRRVAQSVAANEDPALYRAPEKRVLRLAMRVALRQLVHTAPAPSLDEWRRKWDTLEDRADPHAA